jgi:ribonuclease P/MRP protein subunit POP8
MAQTTPALTLRRPPYTYLHLALVTAPSQYDRGQQAQITPLDAVTLLTHLQSALNQSFGLTGTAISIDVLLVKGQESWIRVPFEDGSTVTAAVSQWSNSAKGVAVRVLGRAQWLGGLIAKPQDLWKLG